MRNYYAVLNGRFSNMYDVVAFVDWVARDKAIREAPENKGNNYPISRNRAIKLLGRNLFDPGTVDRRDGNVYLASTNDQIDYEERYAAQEYIWNHDIEGIVEKPVRLIT